MESKMRGSYNNGQVKRGESKIMDKYNERKVN